MDPTKIENPYAWHVCIIPFAFQTRLLYSLGNCIIDNNRAKDEQISGIESPQSERLNGGKDSFL